MRPSQLRNQLLASRELPLRDSFARAALLVALHEAKHLPAHMDMSVLRLCGMVDLDPELVRHHLRVLRAEGAVAVSGRMGRTEFFVLTEQIGTKVADWIAGFGDATSS
ncbi:MAG TPA: hypothetical protein VG897_17995 [Terriglobales bacterium]|nr:hypothetical protein [Terriglobales bacterium]